MSCHSPQVLLQQDGSYTANEPTLSLVA